MIITEEGLPFISNYIAALNECIKNQNKSGPNKDPVRVVEVCAFGHATYQFFVLEEIREIWIRKV